MPKAKKRSKKKNIQLPAANDWRTTDRDEIEKRRMRARDESFQISNTNGAHPIFSNFQVRSASRQTYSVEIRSIRDRQYSCDCVDFRINGLGTCKHIEAVLMQLERRFRPMYRTASQGESTRIDVVPDPSLGTLRLLGGKEKAPRQVGQWFGSDATLRGAEPEEAAAALIGLQSAGMSNLRVSQEVAPWLESRRRAEERKKLRHEYEMRVQTGEWPPQETKVPLFPYQREGMLHLAFTERALLADEMGLGKTIQAIAACALLHRLGQARRVLVVTPASLKTEWEEQIQRFTELPYTLVFGKRPARMGAYEQGEFFTIVNYEQMVRDALEVNARMRPDVVVLDEAQRIKNWSTQTAQAVKRLRSRYAFVLTGTPIENRIDELHSLMDFLEPSVLGPLFRFNRDFYELDDRGRPTGYRNLDGLHARIKPYMLRRRKADVETELPDRTDKNHFVPMSEAQLTEYALHEQQVMRLVKMAERRPLTQQEQDKLMRELAMMRMVCDTNFILNAHDRVCPKLKELEKVLEECQENDAKVIVFSEWERMLELVRGLCEEMDLGFAWHTGSVPQQRRRAEINLFKNDPRCRVFLSTDSGSTGLNLQNANVVINCDLPWNPARLEQRIARAWRKNQTRPVTVVNLISENTLEHRMLQTLATKMAVAESVLDLKGETRIQIRGGRQAFLAKLKQMINPSKQPAASAPAMLPTDRPAAFAERVHEKLGGAFLRCEERYPNEGAHSLLVVVVDRDAQTYREKIAPIHEELFRASDPLAPTKLEVIDRATEEAIQRLIDAGVLSRNTRAARPLGEQAGASPLTPEEQARAVAYREQSARKLKMARLLGEGGLPEEARPALLEAIHLSTRALAIGARLPEPATIEDSLLPPLSHEWKEAAPVLREFRVNSQADWRGAVEFIEKANCPNP